MKRLLLILPLLMCGCASEATSTATLPDKTLYSVTLDAANSTLSETESSEAISLSLKAKENENIIYELEIGSPCYVKQVQGTSYSEIVMKNNGYFKSVSNYKVSLIRCDIYEGKGINYEIYNSHSEFSNQVERKNSTANPIYPEDNGAVYDYEMNSSEWLIRNVSVYKPAFYSVTIFFEV